MRHALVQFICCFFLLFPVVSTSYLVNKDVHKYVYSSKRLAYEFCTDISNSFYRFVLYRFFCRDCGEMIASVGA